jgi:hypothetical protein
LPATGLRVVAPDEAISKIAPGSEIFVMNGNYLAEIQQLTNQRYKYLLVENETI